MKKEREILRSVNKFEATTFLKTGKNIDLSSEAKEIKRCGKIDFTTDDIRTTEFVDFNQDNNTLTLKRIFGTELFSVIWNSSSKTKYLRRKSSCDFETLQHKFFNIGQWLSAYHFTTYEDAIDYSPKSWLKNSFLAKLRGISGMNALDLSSIQRIKVAFLDFSYDEETMASLQSSGLKICRIHGDFMLYNFMIDTTQNIHITDFGDTRVSYNLDDVARLYSHLYAISETSRLRKRIVTPLLEEFLKGYNLDTKILKSRLFRSLLAYNYITHLYGFHMGKKYNSFMTNLCLKQITEKGMAWINSEI